jgi:hypothetical protein
MFGRVQTNSDNRHSDGSPWLRRRYSQPGTFDAVGGRPHQQGNLPSLALGSRFRGNDGSIRWEAALGGGGFALCGLYDAGEHCSGIAVQDLLARFLADLRFGERLPGPVAAELGAVGAAHDALGAV